MEKKKLIVVGAGGRGAGYAAYVKHHPEHAEIVAVADPRDYYRNHIGDEHNIPEERRFRYWQDIAALPRFADAVLICTQDAMHEAPAVAFADLGYHILLEKPMAPTAEACRHIVEAVKRNRVIFGVCHVLLYTPYTQKIRSLIDAGVIGDVVSIQHLEPVGSWHQAHSYVRGNSRNEKESSFMLLAKSCHDLDWIRYIMNERCLAAQSFGSLYEFKADRKPAGAADRCTDCPPEIETKCPYSAIKIYIRDRVRKGKLLWPANVLTPVVTEENVMNHLRNDRFGRCVYACDNDVVDHQTVNLLFARGKTADMTMTAFCNDSGRQTRIFGTRGCIRTDGTKIFLTDFLTDQTTEIDLNIYNDNGILSGHGGGDSGLMKSFIETLVDPAHPTLLSGPDETLESHLMVFAAERSRRENRIVNVADV